MAVVILLMNYFHDLATGLMFGAVVAFFLASGVVERVGGEAGAASLALPLFRRFRPVVLWALAVVLVLGVPRMIFYHDYEYLPAAGRGQIPALVVKHVFLVGITVASLVAFFRKNPEKRHRI